MSFDTEELQRLLAAATPGPWSVSPAANVWAPSKHEGSPMHQQLADVDPVNDTENRIADASLIVAAVNALPELLSDLESAKRQCAELRLELDRLRASAPADQSLVGPKWKRIAPGDRFGFWTALAPARKDGKRYSVRARCDCGTVRDIEAARAMSGKTRSCGCNLMRKARRYDKDRRPTTTYRSYSAMIQRCNDKNHLNYLKYGARGISVCSRWTESFDAFLEDMGPRPYGTSIDRIDNSRGYEPGNCRWASRVEQARNQSNNKILELDGTSGTVSWWAEKTGINSRTIASRLVMGWSVRRALTEPSGAYRADKVMS